MKGFVARVLAAALSLAGPATAAELRDGVALVDAELMIELERQGFGLGAMVKAAVDRVDPTSVSEIVSQPLNLLQIPEMAQLACALRRSILLQPKESPDVYVRDKVFFYYKRNGIDVNADCAALARRGAQSFSHADVNGNIDPDIRFNAEFFNMSNTDFQLVGVLNRMDQGWRGPGGPASLRQTGAETCGEIVFIYRLVYVLRIPPFSSRLPLTLNLVLNARNRDDPAGCAEIAQAWLDSAERVNGGSSFAEKARWLRESGPLRFTRPEHVKQIETNMQVLRLSAGRRPDFGGHAEYVLKVFVRDPAQGNAFVEDPLEDQIDPQKILGDRELLAAYIALLSDRDTLRRIDAGMFEFPEAMRARKAVSVTPGGMSRTQNRVFDTLMSEKRVRSAVSKLVDDLAKAGALANIHSYDGLIYRLNEMTCTGCHQSRSVAGFHFFGANRPGDFENNSVFVPASPVHFGDLPRRRAIVEAYASGNEPDFRRGFAVRPKDDPLLAGTEIIRGWGAACYAGSGDPTFAGWGCGKGLACRQIYSRAGAPPLGICMTAGRAAIGESVETGRVEVCRNDDVRSAAEPQCARKGTKHVTDYYVRLTPDVEGYPEFRAWEFANWDFAKKGDTVPCDYGRFKSDLQTVDPSVRQNYVYAHQCFDAEPSQGDGGFPGGNLRGRNCAVISGPAEKCGLVASDGFNACLATPSTDLGTCLRNHTKFAALRACDIAHPCRDDYICVAPLKPGTVIDLATGKPDKANDCPAGDRDDANRKCLPPEGALDAATTGTCLPPYFVMQFRTDGHRLLKPN